MRTVNKFIFTGLFFVLAVCAFAQAQDSIVHADTTVITAQDVTVVPPDSLKAADSLQVMTDTVPPKKTKVYLIHSNTLSFDKAVKPDAQILNGDVCFRHDSSYMYCDSAYFFEQTNSLEAFSNVRMEQGDTLFVYGDYLFYDGNNAGGLSARECPDGERAGDAGGEREEDPSLIYHRGDRRA